MTATGWNAPDEVPELPLTERLLRNKAREPGDTLAIALARSRAAEAREARDEAAGASDPDEAAASLIARGYAPGLVSDLVRRRQDKEAELEGERAKLEKGERVSERVRGMLARGQVGGLEAARMLDGDFGDVQRAAQLERQIARLDAELAGAQSMIAPPQQRAEDPLEAATRRAHQAFVEVTRAKWADARQGGTAPRRERRRGPFASRGDAVRSEEVTCPECIAFGITPEQSYLIHADPDAPPGVALPLAAEGGQVVETGRGAWSYDRARGGMSRVEQWPRSFDTYGRVISRTVPDAIVSAW